MANVADFHTTYLDVCAKKVNNVTGEQVKGCLLLHPAPASDYRYMYSTWFHKEHVIGPGPADSRESDYLHAV